jgi:hypothetical protein
MMEVMSDERYCCGKESRWKGTTESFVGLAMQGNRQEG